MSDGRRAAETRLTLLLVCLFALAGAVSAQAVSVVPGSEREYGGRTYLLLTASTWPDAQAFAETLGGHLVVVNDAEENEWVFETYSAGHTQFLWIGFFQDPEGAEPDGGWQWVDGSPVTYTAWDAGEPNNQGGAEEYAHMFWRDTIPATVWNDAPINFWGTCYGVVEFGPVFEDVPEDHWAYEEIMACVLADIVNGYPDGRYHPGDQVRRSQMAVFISRALAGGDAEVPEPDPGTQTFSDVASAGFGEDGTQPYWAYKYIEDCAAQAVAEGYPEGDYKPERPVSRGEMAVYIARGMVAPTGDAGLPTDSLFQPPSFPDVPRDHWAYLHIEYCVEQGVVGGFPEGDYRPDVVVTRDQMAVYVSRAFDLLG